MDQDQTTTSHLDALLAAERERGYQMAVRHYDGLSVAPLEPSAPRVYKPTPIERHGIDPLTQRMVGGGVFLAGVGAAGWGLSFLFEALAQATTALGLVAVIGGMVCYLRRSGSSGTNGTPVNVNVTVRQNNRF